MSEPTPTPSDLEVYEAQTWVDVPPGTTPPSGALKEDAASFNRMEDGIHRGHLVAVAAWLLLQSVKDDVEALPEQLDALEQMIGTKATTTALQALADSTTTALAAKATTTALNAAVAGLTTPEQATALAQTAAAAAVSAVIDGAPDAANTLRELKNLLDANASGDASTAAALAALVDVVSGKATPAQITAAINGLATVARTGSYTDLLNKPTIPAAPDLTPYVTKTAADAAYQQVWRANTAYLAGAKVVSPAGQIVQRKADGTSGATYDPTAWDIIASGNSAFSPWTYDVTKTPYSGVLDGAADGTTGTGIAAAINAAVVDATAAWVATGIRQVVFVPSTGSRVALVDAPIVLRSGVSLRLGTGVTLRRKTTLAGAMLTNAAATPLRTLSGLAMTSGSTTVTSSTANFTSADIGRSISVTGAAAGGPTDSQSGGTLYGYITAVTDTSTATLSYTATATVSGSTGWIMGRDSAISVVGEDGATISYGSNAAGAQTNGGCHSYFRNVDGISVMGAGPGRPLRVITASGTEGGRYAVYFYACTNSTAQDIDFATQSDGVHIQGRSSGITVRRITGSTGDDSVAIVVPDRGGISDGDFGDVTDVLIEDVDTVAGASTNNVKLLPGQWHNERYTVRNWTVRRVRGTAGLNLVCLGLPTGTGVYAGGYLDKGLLEDLPRSRNLKVPVLSYITVRDLVARNVDQVSISNGVTMNTLAVEKCRWAFGTTSFVPVQIGGTGTSVGQVVIRDCQYENTSSSGQPISIASGVTVGLVSFENWAAVRCAWALGQYTNTGTVVQARGVRVSTATGLIRVDANCSVELATLDGVYSVAPNLQSGATLRSRSFGLRTDVSTLAKNAGDMATNTNSALACGTGLVTSDGTVWKNLFSGATT